MKLNKYLITLFISSCFMSNICLSLDENDQMEKVVHEEKKSSEQKIEKLERPARQENTNEVLTRPNHSDLPQENFNTEQVIEKPKKIKKKVQKKENPKNVEQISEQPVSSNVESNNQESKPTGVDLSTTDSSSVEFQEFRGKSSSPQQDRNSKEYVIRGLVSMLLVIAGAILLVVVIITGVNNKKKKR